MKNRGHPNLDKVNQPAAAGLAWALWGTTMLVISVLVYIHPFNTNLCTTYAPSSFKWWDHRDLYYAPGPYAIDGFLYFPQFAILYTPFAVAGNPVGDIAWRLLGAALYCGGLWRLSKLLSPQRALLIFAFGTFAAVAPSISSIRCAQSNVYLAGFLLNTTVELSHRRWWGATAWLILSLAAKPIMFVMILLAMVVYPPMSWRLILGLIVFLLFPFMTQSPHYVMAQYEMCETKLAMASLPDRAFCDLRGLLWKSGWIMPQRILAMLQWIAGGLTLMVCLLASRWRRDPSRSVFVAGMCASYLMLFNPRTESNSYVILTGILAITAAALYVDHRRGSALAALIATGVCLSCDGWLYRPTEDWLKPLTCVVLTFWLIRETYADSLRQRREPFLTPASSAQATTGLEPTN
jgi:alpha-1,2-mannosyltransferase